MLALESVTSDNRQVSMQSGLTEDVECLMALGLSDPRCIGLSSGDVVGVRPDNQ